jgi:hypothetical protein
MAVRISIMDLIKYVTRENVSLPPSSVIVRSLTGAIMLTTLSIMCMIMTTMAKKTFEENFYVS